MRISSPPALAIAMLALASGFVFSPACAQTTPAAEKAVRGPPAALAVEAAQVAIATCATAGASVTVVVLDEDGNLKISLASDGALARTQAIARRKAFTALTYRTNGDALAERIAADRTLAAEIDAQPDTLFARPRGGRLIMAGDAIRGAIGVSGAITPPGGTSGSQDDACARAGLDAIAARLR